jgi:hypothetical protein
VKKPEPAPPKKKDGKIKVEELDEYSAMLAYT